MLAPVSHRFATIRPDQFRQEIEKVSTAEQAWKELAVSQVEEETISPTQAVGIISAVTAQLYGFSEFNRELTPADLVLLQQQYGR